MEGYGEKKKKQESEFELEGFGDPKEGSPYSESLAFPS
jgi:hypothetical protein